MIKEVDYKGFTASPSDYECQDGEQAILLNLVPENEALKPILPPKVLAKFEGVVKVFVHANFNYKHYIICANKGTGQTFNWCTDSFEQHDPFLEFGEGENIIDMAGIGNMIVISSSMRTHYILWKDDTYKYMGDKLPNVQMGFALRGEMLSKAYPDTKLQLNDEGISSSKEQFSKIKSVHFKLKTGQEYDGYNYYSEYMLLDNDIVFEENSDYRFYGEFNSHGDYYIDIEGKDSKTGEYVKLLKNVPLFVRLFSYLHTKSKYTDIRLRANTFHKGRIAENTIIIEKGNSLEVSVSQTILNTKENLDILLGIENSFLNKHVFGNGRFIYPFFVRYAVKLYDGTYTNISPPVLMIPNTGYVPLLNYANRPTSKSIVKVDAYAFVAELEYYFAKTIDEDWEGIVEGIDIFVSAPIYPYNQGVVFESTDENLIKYKVLDNDKNINEIKYIDYGLFREFSGLYKPDGNGYLSIYDVMKEMFSFGQKGTANQWRIAQPAPYTEAEIKTKISDISNFYHIHSFSFNEITKGTDEFKKLDLKRGVLKPEVLVNRKRLEDGLLSNRTLLKSNIHTYNNRVHAYNVSFRLPEPVPFDLQNQMYEKPVYGDNFFFIYLKTNTGRKIVKAKMLKYQDPIRAWFYYPDSRAYKIVFRDFYNDIYREMPLKKHEKLIGAYWLADNFYYSLSELPVVTPPNDSDVDDIILEPTNIYVSEVNNPFKFNDSLTVPVGCTSILKLSSAAKAMSTGQFGRFPLYAFTDNGVWALEVMTTGDNIGGYVARQPFTRDIPVKSESIIQIDSAVLFATDRGIMLLEGSQSICISDDVSNESIVPVTNLPAINKVFEMVGTTRDKLNILPFVEYIRDCRMIYDYEHQHIMICNPACNYAYVWSLKSKKWGMMQSDVTETVNSYPDALAILRDGTLVSFSDDTESIYKNLSISRPLRLDAPNVFKTIDTVIQRGLFHRGHVKSALYGSNDLYNWVIVGTSADHYLRGFRGSPYKYFRIVLITELSKDECISGCSIAYRVKQNNQLR